ncbi:hypothetical protein KIN20_035003, partial [Parelaphostrongylus tenuis]
TPASFSWLGTVKVWHEWIWKTAALSPILTIHSLSTNCNGLSELSLSHCELITDESIHCLCTNNKDKLQVLELDNCPQITDSALSHMRHAKALKRIDLYDCPEYFERSHSEV